MLMPFSFSITNGIGFGFIAYVLIRAAQGRVRDVHPLMWAVSAAFTLYFFVPRSDPDKIDVNARCLDDIDLAAMSPKPFDGKNWEAAMQTSVPWR